MGGRQSVRAAAVQIAPVLDEKHGTAAKVCEWIGRAAAAGAELVVFPETFVPYYPYFAFVRAPALSGREHLQLYEWALTLPGPESEAFADAARRHGVCLVIGVNERDHGTLYNTQLIFDADGKLLLKRRKLTPTFHERMIWGQGDASGLRVVEAAVGRIGALACWEHYNPLARYALMTQHEQIHCAQFPGSMVGQIFAEQIEVTLRHHALEAGCFVVNATGWLTDAQRAGLNVEPALQPALRGGCLTAIVSPEGKLLCEPRTEGEGLVLAELDLSLITKRKGMLDSVGHYARPELLRLWIDDRPQTTWQRQEGDARPAPSEEKASAVPPRSNSTEHAR
jgi:nitrilase